MPDEKTQPQGDEATGEGAQEGVASPLTEPQPAAVVQPGAETKAPPERTYTEAEWSKRESAKDREISEARSWAAELSNRLLLAEEAASKAEDHQAVERGELTEEEANQRASARQQLSVLRGKVAQGESAYNAMMAQGEQLGRILAANDFAKEFGVEAEELLKDASLTNPVLMRLKAKEFQLTKRENALKPQSETYDTGQVGSAGADINRMSPEEKIRWALAHPPRKKS